VQRAAVVDAGAAPCWVCSAPKAPPPPSAPCATPGRATCSNATATAWGMQLSCRMLMASGRCKQRMADESGHHHTVATLSACTLLKPGVGCTLLGALHALFFAGSTIDLLLVGSMHQPIACVCCTVPALPALARETFRSLSLSFFALQLAVCFLVWMGKGSTAQDGVYMGRGCRDQCEGGINGKNYCRMRTARG
jgi:hypothetical protein